MTFEKFNSHSEQTISSYDNASHQNDEVFLLEVVNEYEEVSAFQLHCRQQNPEGEEFHKWTICRLFDKGLDSTIQSRYLLTAFDDVYTLDYDCSLNQKDTALSVA